VAFFSLSPLLFFSLLDSSCTISPYFFSLSVFLLEAYLALLFFFEMMCLQVRQRASEQLSIKGSPSFEAKVVLRELKFPHSAVG